jgi:hypothetical protein
MASGTSACYADVIEAENVKKISPIAYKSFLKVLKTQKVTLEDFAVQYQRQEVQNEKCLKAWNQLANDFEGKTKVMTSVNLNGVNSWAYSVGLQLGISFHDIDESGDRYDEVNGVFFYVDGVYQKTPAGKEIGDMVERKFYTQFG